MGGRDIFFGEKVGKKRRNNWETSETEKKQKRTRPRRVPTDRDSESGRTQSPQKGKKKRKIRKRKKRKRIRPRRVPTDRDSESGPRRVPTQSPRKVEKRGKKGGNLQVEISLSPNFGAERTLIDPISVTSKFHIFQRFSGFKLISSINNNIKKRPA